MCEITFPCGELQQQTIKRACAKAKGWLEISQKAMENYTAAPKSSKSVAQALRANFGWSGDEYDKLPPRTYPDIPRIVLSTLKTLRANIDRPVMAACKGTESGEALNPKVKGELTKVLARVIEDHENCFQFTADYFKAEGIRQAQTVLHEMCHAWCAMDDVAYEGDPAWKEKNFRSSSENADSYACLIRDLGKS